MIWETKGFLLYNLFMKARVCQKVRVHVKYSQSLVQIAV